MNTSILPRSDNTYDLGSSSKRWGHLYISNDIVMGPSYGYESIYNGLYLSRWHMIITSGRLLSDFWGNMLFYADKRYTINVTGNVHAVESAFRPGDTSMYFDDTIKPVIIEVNGSLSGDTNVGEQRFFVQFRTPYEGSLKIEVLKSDGTTWVTLYDNPSLSADTMEFVFSNKLSSAGLTWPDDYPLQAVRFTFDNFTGTQRIKQLGQFSEPGHAYSIPYLQKAGDSLLDNFLPYKDATYNIGSSSYKWKNGYFSGTVYASTFSGNIDWSNITNKPTIVTSDQPKKIFVSSTEPTAENTNDIWIQI